MTLLKYATTTKKPKQSPSLKEQQGIYDFLFNGVPLTTVAKTLGIPTSGSATYLLVKTVVIYWAATGKLTVKEPTE